MSIKGAIEHDLLSVMSHTIIGDIVHYAKIGLDTAQIVAAVVHTHNRAEKDVSTPTTRQAVEELVEAVLNCYDACFAKKGRLTEAKD